jgi:hypothetical protein
MLISALLLLIDDYYGYMEGKDALLGKYWDKLNNFLDTAKQKYEELKATVEPYWDKFIGYIEQAKKWFDELMTSIDEWSSSTGAEILNDFIDECKDWWRILNDLYDTIENGIKVTWQSFMESLEKNDTINDVRQLLERLWRIFVILYKAVKDVIEGVIQLADEIAKTEEWQEFIAVVGELFDGIVELFDAIMELVEVALTALFGQFDKTDIVFSFRDVLRAVLKVFTGIIRAVNWVIGLLKDLFNLVAGNKTFKKFWEEVGNTIGEAISKVGMFGNKLRELWDWITGKSSSKGGKGGSLDKAGGGNNEEQLWSMMKADGLTDEGAAAILGNFLQEDSTLDPSVSEDGTNTFKIDGKTGFGIAQWTDKGRQRKLQEMADEQGMSVYDLKLQYMNLRREMQEYGIWDDFKTSHDLRALTKKFHDEYEGSDDYNRFGNIEHRHNYASQVLGRNQGKTYFVSDDKKPIGHVGYTGDFDTSKWNIWSSTEGANTTWDSTVTDIRGWQQEVVDFMNDAGDALNRIGVKGTITGAAEKNTSTKKYHNKGRYSHENGYKVDISDSNIPYGSEAYEILKTLAESHGGRLDYEADKAHYDITIYPQGVLGFADAQTAAALGGQPVSSTGMSLPFGGIDLGKLDEVKNVLGQLKGMLPADYLDSLSETLGELTEAGKNAGFYDAMQNGMPEYGRGSMSMGGMTVSIDVGGVTINGQGKTNEDIGRVVGEQILSSVAPVFGQTAQYLMQNCMANINAVPTPTPD